MFLVIFVSSGPLRVLFKENRDSTYTSKSFISVKNCQLRENGDNSILYSDDAVGLHSLTAVYVFMCSSQK